MSKKLSFLIQSLDEGYTVTEKGKRKAFENSINVEQHIIEKIRFQISGFARVNVNNMFIQVEVDENCPNAVNVMP